MKELHTAVLYEEWVGVGGVTLNGSVHTYTHVHIVHHTYIRLCTCICKGSSRGIFRCVEDG